MFDTYRIFLHKQGYRMTPQRMTILRILNDTSRHMTPREVYESAKQTLPGITEPTIYRTLSFLSAQGLLMAAHVGSGQLVYEAAGQNHHHLICRKCGQNCEISHELLKPLYDRLSNDTGFLVDGVHVTIFGLCPNCLKSHKDFTSAVRKSSKSDHPRKSADQ